MLSKKSLQVHVQHPVHFLPLQSHIQRVQRVMRVAFRSEPVGEAQKVFLINLIEDSDYSLLDNLVLQRRNPQRSQFAVGLLYIGSLGGLRSIRSAVHTAVQIFQSIFHARLILFPCHSVHSRRCFTFQSVIAFPQQIDAHMVKQGGEPFLLVLSRSFAHTIQPLVHPFSTLRWLVVRLHDVLLGQRPSLRTLRLPRFHEVCSDASRVLRLCSTPP
jgi:hypothetical protein